MTITSQSGVFGFGVQSDKGALAAAWYRHKALSMSLGPVVEKEIAPPEIGGAHNPTGAYKSGAFYAGRATLLPRLEGDFGWLLLGMNGYVAAPVALGSGATQHVFSQAPIADGGAAFIPWMSFRRHIPGRSTASDLGDIGQDCVINSATFTLPQVGPVAVDLDVTGRIPTLDDAPDIWAWEDTYEEFESVPMSMAGTFRLPLFAAGAQPATGARVTLMNNTTTVREERIIGSYFPDDFAPRQRIFQVEWTYKWADPDLARFIFNNADPVSPDFQPCIDTTDCEIIVESPCPIEPGVIDQPWRLRFFAPNMDWREAGPIVLAGDEMLMQQYTGIAIETPGVPETYFTITLENDQVTSYPIPAP
jgi:hypothetical protein